MIEYISQQLQTLPQRISDKRLSPFDAKVFDEEMLALEKRESNITRRAHLEQRVAHQQHVIFQLRKRSYDELDSFDVDDEIVQGALCASMLGES